MKDQSRLAQGLLWYEPGQPIAAIITNGVRRFREKYGIEPGLALVEAVQAGELERECAGVKVYPSVFVSRDHAWICVSFDVKFPKG